MFAAIVDALFADPHLARDALYASGGDAAPVRVILKRPDAILDFGQARVAVATVIIDVRASEVAAPKAGDTVSVGDDTYTVQGEPLRHDPDHQMGAGQSGTPTASAVFIGEGSMPVPFPPPKPKVSGRTHRALGARQPSRAPVRACRSRICAAAALSRPRCGRQPPRIGVGPNWDGRCR